MSGYVGGPCAGVGQQTSYGSHCGNMGSSNGLSGPCQVIGSTAAGEKAHMQNLNDRLSAYIQRIRNMKQDSGAIDPSCYHENLRILENEIQKLKCMYEQELDRLRRALDDCCRDKNACLSKSNANSSIIADLEGRLAAEADKARRAADDLARCQQCLCQKDKELCDARANLKACCDELNDLRARNNRDSGGLHDMRNKLDQEMRARQQACDLVKQLQDKLAFDKQLCDQEKRDLQDRVNASDGIIRGLEDKIKQLTQRQDADMGKILQNLRDSHAAELRRAQADTEQALNKSLGTLKSQLDDEKRCKGELGRQKSQMEDCIRQLQGKIADLEAQLRGCCDQKNSLDNQLSNEKARAANEIRCLEDKLRQLQDMIMNKVKECNNARDIQMSLQGEIDAYKGMLDAEEARLRNAGGGTTGAPMCPPRPVTTGPICPPRQTVTFNTSSSTSYNNPCPPTSARPYSAMAGSVSASYNGNGNGNNPFAAMCSQYANAAANGQQQRRITLDLNCGAQSARPSMTPGARVPPPCSQRGDYQFRTMSQY